MDKFPQKFDDPRELQDVAVGYKQLANILRAGNTNGFI